MKPETLIKEWKSAKGAHRNQARLDIVNNAYCPDELIHQALFSLDHDKVLELPNITVKALWGDDTFIQMCLALKQGKMGFRPQGYQYYTGSVENKLLLYLETIYTNSDARKLQCLSSLNNRVYIHKLLKLHPELTDLTKDNTNLSYNLAFHLYSKDEMSLAQLLNLCIDYGPVSSEEPDIMDYFPEFSVTAINSIKKLCTTLELFPNIAFRRLFEVFIAGTDSSFYISRMRSSFKEQIYKYRSDWGRFFDTVATSVRQD